MTPPRRAAARPVLLGPEGSRDDEHLATLADLAARAQAVAGHARPALELLERLDDVPPPGEGRTLERWEVLATLGAADLTAARVAEAHLDALAILHEAPAPTGRYVLPGIYEPPPPPPPGPRPGHPHWSSWGVFAAEAPGLELVASGSGPSWTLTGTKPWCSLAGLLTKALVTAHTDAGRRLFAVDLRHTGVHVRADRPWVSRGLAAVVSTAVDFEAVLARAVGEPGWYLHRPGFAWGGLGVAACWYGGAVGLARTLRQASRAREPDQIALAHLGAVDVALAAAAALLAHAATAVDAGRADGADGAALALRVRSGVAAAAEEVLTRVGHALGPAPLAFDDQHARRASDLTVYLRQHHAERDLAALGGAVLAADGWSW